MRRRDNRRGYRCRDPADIRSQCRAHCTTDGRVLRALAERIVRGSRAAVERVTSVLTVDGATTLDNEHLVANVAAFLVTGERTVPRPPTGNGTTGNGTTTTA